jgi:glyoxylase-like metal-dependent hydrolase (beta-lactamase superfamily II)
MQSRLALPVDSKSVLENPTMQVISGIYSLWQSKGANVHAFLLDDGHGLTLLDTLYDVDAHRILNQIQAIGRRPSDIKHIILTHAHRSHLGGLRRLKQLSGAPVYAHEWESDLISGDRNAQCVSWRPQSPYRTYPLQVANNLGFIKHPPVQVDHFIHEGDQVGPLRVMHTPGHSPGHLAFYWENRQALFSGDAIVTWPSFDLGWSGFLLNFKQHEASLRHMAELDSEVLCVGHGEPLAAGAAQRIRQALQADRRWR